METSPLSYINETIDYLVSHGASIFALGWLQSFMTKNLPTIVPTMILAPTDNAIDKLVKASNRTWQEITRLPEGINILENHVSVRATQKKWPMLTSVNDLKFGSDENDIRTLSPLNSTTIRLHSGKSLVIIVIDEILLHEDQLAKLRSSKLGYSTWQRGGVEHIKTAGDHEDSQGISLADVGRDIFGYIINQGLTGRNLLALCSTDDRARIMCDRDDQILFKRLLQQEFNFEWSQGFAKESPRELYAKFHSSRIDVYVSTSDWINVSGKWMLIENNKITVANSIKATLQSSYTRISLPVDSRFVANLKFISPMHFFYVKDKPETATLIRAHRNDIRGIRAEPTIEASNNWFTDYFAGKSLAPAGFQNLRDFRGTVDGLIQSILRTRSTALQVKVLINNIEETVVYLQLYNNQLHN